MSLLFGCMCNDPAQLACALNEVRAALVDNVSAGWGLAFYQGGEPLLRRQPQPHGGPLDFSSLLQELHSDYIVGHVRDPGYKQKLENTQPFRFRAWIWAQRGHVLPPAEFAAIEGDLLAGVPDFFRRNIRGASDAERLFYLFLSFLHDTGSLDDPNLKVVDVAAALGGTLELVARHTLGAAPQLDLVVTNGRLLMGVRRGLPMAIHKVNGIKDCARCRLAEQQAGMSASDRHRIAHERLRSVLLLSHAAEILAQHPGVELVPEDTIVGVSRDLTTSLHPLTPPV